MARNKPILFWLVSLEIYTYACAAVLGYIVYRAVQTPHESVFFVNRLLGIVLFAILFTGGKLAQWDMLVSLWRDDSSLALRVFDRIMRG